MEHLGKLPPRETADALVYRCLDSMEPFLSKTTSNYTGQFDYLIWAISTVTLHAPTFKQEVLTQLRTIPLLLTFDSIWNSGKIPKASPQPGCRYSMGFYAAAYGWTIPPTPMWQA